MSLFRQLHPLLLSDLERELTIWTSIWLIVHRAPHDMAAWLAAAGVGRNDKHARHAAMATARAGQHGGRVRRRAGGPLLAARHPPQGRLAPPRSPPMGHALAYTFGGAVRCRADQGEPCHRRLGALCSIDCVVLGHPNAYLMFGGWG